MCNNYIENIVNEVNNILIERNNRPCSYHVSFINKLSGYVFEYYPIS